MCARRLLVPIPALPFCAQRDVSELVHFTRAIREAIGSVGEVCGDLHPVQWTRGWSRCLERNVCMLCAPRRLTRGGASRTPGHRAQRRLNTLQEGSAVG